MAARIDTLAKEIAESSSLEFDDDDLKRYRTYPMPDELETAVQEQSLSGSWWSTPTCKFPEERSRRFTLTENIDQWFKGQVIDINWEEGYFTSQLKDLSGTECIAEFDIDRILPSKEDAKNLLFQGSTFAFYVVTQHGHGSPRTISNIEFSMPYIWQKGDDEKVFSMVDEQSFDEFDKSL